jgi:6-phosphogluconate dehydrogenase (decarboxylating)
MTSVYQTRDHVENSLAGLWIVSPSLEERVQIEQLAAHLDEYLQYSKRQLIHS